MDDSVKPSIFMSDTVLLGNRSTDWDYVGFPVTRPLVVLRLEILESSLWRFAYTAVRSVRMHV